MVANAEIGWLLVGLTLALMALVCGRLCGCFDEKSKASGRNECVEAGTIHWTDDQGEDAAVARFVALETAQATATLARADVAA